MEINHKGTKAQRGEMKKPFESSSLRGEHLRLRDQGTERDQMKHKDMEIDHKDTKAQRVAGKIVSDKWRLSSPDG